MYEDIHTNEDVHIVRRGANNHSNHNQCRTNESNIATAYEIRYRSNEWTYGSQCEQVCENEPDPNLLSI